MHKLPVQPEDDGGSSKPKPKGPWTVGVVLHENDMRRLNAEVRRTDRPKSWLLRKALQEYLDKRKRS